MELFKIGFITFQLVDIFDIGIAAFLIYRIYLALKDSQAMRVVWLVLIFFLAWKAVDLLNMVLLKSFLSEVIGLGSVALVILFAPEIRRFLGNITRNTLADRLFRTSLNKDDQANIVRSLSEGISQLRHNQSGALIVIAGNQSLKEVIETGDRVEAIVSSRLLFSIFQKYSPLHDGAVIIQNGRIAAARCILPISRSQYVPAELGLRHRAALGLVEQNDALVIVLSEERQELSLAQNGRIRRGEDVASVMALVEKYLKTEGES
ncbi:MAG: diadenylate cyclase CdaA [Bacteroidia bacterium]